MDSKHDETEGCGEGSRERKAQLAMGQLSSQDQASSTNPVSQDEPLPTTSPIVQQKLAQMKELLKNLKDNHTYDRGMAYYEELIYTRLSMEEVVMITDAAKPFATNALMYEWELNHNINKIETSQFVKLSELQSLREVPKLLSFEEIEEALNAEKNE